VDILPQRNAYCGVNETVIYMDVFYLDPRKNQGFELP
jgi:hypothetical protein